MRRVNFGKVCLSFGIVLFLLSLIAVYDLKNALFFVSLLFIILGIVCWYTGKRKELNEIKKSLQLIEDSIRRCKSLIMEKKLGGELETVLDSIRAEIIELYNNPKHNETVKRILATIGDSSKELIRYIESKEVKKIKYQFGVLRDRIADLRSEFRR